MRATGEPKKAGSRGDVCRQSIQQSDHWQGRQRQVSAEVLFLLQLIPRQIELCGTGANVSAVSKKATAAER